MRVIAGKYKGRKLMSPADDRIRPTTDKVKEAMFSILIPYLDEAVIIDMFAGTGGLGIEGLSRGALKCYFMDSSRDSLKLLRANIAHCGAEKESVVLAGDSIENLACVKDRADIIIIDPPYREGLYEESLEKIKELDLLDEDGVIVLEHDSRLPMEDEIAGFVKIKERKYGHIMLSLFSIENE